MSATVIAFKPKPKPPDGGDLNRRPCIILRKLFYELLEMTPRQAELAFWSACGDEERWQRNLDALDRYHAALKAFRPELAAYREVLLSNMDAYYPRAAKRIREGKPPRSRRKALDRKPPRR
jgi:hypothetical protein